MSNTAWLFVAFAIVWIAIGAYLWSLGSRQKRLEAHLRQLDDVARTQGPRVDERANDNAAQTHNL
ncbi:MAG: CcmD family protein [Actinomycetota bacterium]|nr:CcmD family protein [Actinomycetota bacterium]